MFLVGLRGKEGVRAVAVREEGKSLQEKWVDGCQEREGGEGNSEGRGVGLE